MKYDQQQDGDVVHPVMKGYRIRCCDCSLVHVLDFYVVKKGKGYSLSFKVRRDNRATAACRRKKRKKHG